MAAAQSTVKVPVLSRDGNYRQWASKMEAFLITQDGGLDRWLEDDPEEGNAAQIRGDRVCKAKIQLHVTGALQQIVARARTARIAWEALEQEYVGALRVRQPQLTRELSELRQGSDGLMKYIDKARDLRDQFEDLGMQQSVVLLHHQFIRGLNDKLRVACASELNAMVMRQGDEDNPAATLEDLIDTLWGIVSLLPDGVAQVNAIGGRDRPDGGPPKGPRKETRTCHYCGKPGHLKRDCRKLKKDKGEGDSENPGPAAVFATVAKVSGKGCPNERDWLWYDCGATHNVTYDETLLRNKRRSPISVVALGGGEEHAVECEGTMVLTGGPAGEVHLEQVLSCPTLKLHLMSGNQATKKGAEVIQRHSGITIRDRSGRVVLTGTKDAGMYKLHCRMLPVEGGTPSAFANVAVAAETWHRRLGHRAFGKIVEIAKSGAVTGMGEVRPLTGEKCEICPRAKQTRATYPRSSSRAKEPLELLHSDVMGPFRIEGELGQRFVVTLRDDYSRFSDARAVKRKSEVAEQIVQLMVLWERQTGRKVKRLRTDWGSEFMGKLKALCLDCGIKREHSATYTPQQNGRAERLNRTLLEGCRALLLDRQMPRTLWPYAMETAAYLHNLVPSGGDKMTPHELFFGKKPDVSHLRVLGCKATVHIPSKKRDKLDAVSRMCLFLGYSRESKAWRFWDVDENRCFESANAVFDEDRVMVALRQDNRPEESFDYNFLEFVDGPGEEPHGEADDSMSDEEPESESDTGSVSGSSSQGSEMSESDGESGGAAGGEEEERRYPARERRAPTDPYHAYANATEGVPATYKEAMKRSDAPLWEEAKDAEVTSLYAMGVCEVCELPRGKVALPSKAVIDIKRDEKGEIIKYKYRLVALGCRQVAGRDYEEVFAPTAQSATFRILLAEAAANELELRQADVSTAFMNGDLTEELYLRPPPEVDLGGKVWRLHKAINGLKQGAKAWSDKLTAAMEGEGMVASQTDPCLFVSGQGESRTLMLVHVDDAAIAARPARADWAVGKLRKHFKIKDLGALKLFLGQEARRVRTGIFLTQEHYAKQVLQRFNMWECQPKATPMEAGHQLTSTAGEPLREDDSRKGLYMEIVGALLFISTHTRPDLAYSVGVLSRFMSAPTDRHFQAAKRVLRYLRGTHGHGLFFQRQPPLEAQGVQTYASFGAGSGIKLETYSDADLAGDLGTRKSTTGMVVMANGAPILWSSKLQSTVATSTCEAEYIAAAAAVREGLWVRKLLGDVHGRVERMPVYCDNQSAVALATRRTAGVSGRSKHIDIQHHFVRERNMRGDIEVKFVPTGEQKADVFTKALPGPAFGRARAAIMGAGKEPSDSA